MSHADPSVLPLVLLFAAFAAAAWVIYAVKLTVKRIVKKLASKL
jgi:hypothetical protein